MRRARVKKAAPANACRNVGRRGERGEAEDGCTAKAGSDPLIAPRVATLAALLRAGKLTPEEQVRWYCGAWPRVPKGLLPFIESPRPEKFAEVLKAHPRLYWHPVVARQMLHLLRLIPECGREGSSGASVALHLKALIKAHADGLRLGGVIAWERSPRKSGRKGGVKNPYPAMPGDERIDPTTLARDFEALHGLVKGKLKERKGRGGWTERDKEDYRTIALKALRQSGIEWSRLQYEGAKSDTPTGAMGKESLDADCFTASDFVEPWESAEVVLSGIIRKKLDEADTLYKKDGVPACLTYALLAALLDQSPTTIRDALDYQRRKKGTPARPSR